MPHDNELQNILAFLHQERSVDFSDYKPGTLVRRINLRLLTTGTPDYPAYRRYLDAHPAEIDELFAALTITVSRFFRNPLTFEILREFILPQLLEAAPPGGLRIWCAGCARGEEAYSLAILYRELCRQEGWILPLYLLATDIDLAALAVAARGHYPEEALVEVKKATLDQYFTPERNGYQIKEEIRSLVIFARHDLTTCQAPRAGIFSDYHLILCRNTLIYFNRDLGARVVTSLARSLLPNGMLVLGEAETIPSSLARHLREIFPRTHIYRKEGD